MKTVLLLAGTAEARRLAERITLDGKIDLIASLAGVTTTPRAYPCQIRRGGFGGAAGLCHYIQTQRITALIDATHPYANRISAHAAEAAAATETPLLALIRPQWPPIGTWQDHATLADALAHLPKGATVLVTTGRETAPHLATRPDIRFILRSIEPLADLPPNVTPLRARPPFTLASETALMRDRNITHLLTKNSGGDSRSRLDAAAALNLPIHVLARPLPAAANSVAGVDSAFEWLAAVLRD